jgi:16S rRNA (cytosine967-C5)-methyltransferase
LCAAPGGKSTHLAELAEGQASIVATDVHPRRFGIMLENLRRLDTPGLTARPWDLVVERRLDDAAREDSPEDGRPRLGSDHPAPGLAGSFDLVLLDAPCSGLGTLRRHPEIRHRLRPDDLKRLSRNQLRLLRLASEFVRPGGRLIYSTCTITAQENLRVVEGFLRAAPAWSVEGEPDHLSGDLRRLRSSDGFFRTWPAHKELDGFELVVLVRSERPVPGGGLRNLHRG